MLDVVTTLHHLIESLTELSSGESIAEPSSQSHDLPLLLDAEETARLLSVSRAKVRDMASRGEIPSVHVGRLIRIPRDPLLTWIKQYTNAAECPAPPRLPEWMHVDRRSEL